MITFDPFLESATLYLRLTPVLEPPTMYLHLTPSWSPCQRTYIILTLSWSPPPRNILTFDPFLEPPYSLPTFILGQQCLTLVAISLFNTKKFKMLHILHSFFIVILVFNSFKCTSRRKQSVCRKP